MSRMSNLHLIGSVIGPLNLAGVMAWLWFLGKYESAVKFWIFAGLVVGFGLVPLVFLFRLDVVDEFVERLLPNVERLISFRPGLLLVWSLNFLIYLEAIALTSSFLPEGRIVR